MSSFTLTFSGQQSILHSDYFPPIELDPHYEYVCGLVDFQTYNSIPNITKSNNAFYYIDIFNEIKRNEDEFLEMNGANAIPLSLSMEKEDETIFEQTALVNPKIIKNIVPSVLKKISIPVGSYEIGDIIEYITNKMQEDGKHITIQVNKNTLKTEIHSEVDIDFTREDSIGSLLGFDKIFLKKDTTYEATKPVNIFKVNTIRIECDLIMGAYINDTSSHTIHEFYPTVSAGYKIVQVPNNVIYLPVSRNTIRSIYIKIVDQDSNLIDFRGETITCRIHIKRLS